MRLRSLLLALAGVTSVACAAILDLQPPPEGGVDDASNDGVAVDAGADSSGCAALDASLPNDDADTMFRAFAQQTVDDAGTHAITYFDLSTLPGTPMTFEGAAFDGAHIYLAPATPGGLFLQYTVGKTISSGWKTFAPTVLTGAQSFSGAVFDGRYVYFVPHQLASSASSGVVLRYDTTASFTMNASWSTFDAQQIPVNDGGTPARGFNGGSFDGRFVYFVPNNSAPAVPDGRVARFDTQGDASVVDAGDAAPPTSFATPGNWSTYDFGAQSGIASGFSGAVFDGHYLYLVPDSNQTGLSGYIGRYDTTAAFTSTSSWSSYGIAPKNADAVGFTGGAFDGRYMYLVPHHNTIVARYDTQAGFGTSGSFTLFDLATVVHVDGGAPSYAGATFDGRFVYFAPSQPGFGVVARYDILSSFTSSCAWTTYDVSKPDAIASDFFGAIYDGRYLYLVPHETVLVRFDTKNVSWMPALPGYAGSFY